jgi:hypothetical protein
LLLLLADESPDFIALDVLHRDVHDQPRHELLALLASDHQELEDRVTVQAGDSLDGADGAALYEQLEDLDDFGNRDIGAVDAVGRSFAVRRAALPAAVPLGTVAVLPVFLAAAVAGFASHDLIIQQALAVCKQKNALIKRES